jgi:hypothetical protein
MLAKLTLALFPLNITLNVASMARVLGPEESGKYTKDFATCLSLNT